MDFCKKKLKEIINPSSKDSNKKKIPSFPSENNDEKLARTDKAAMKLGHTNLRVCSWRNFYFIP